MCAFILTLCHMQSDEFDENGHHVVGDEGGDNGAIVEIDTSPAGELKRAERVLGYQFVEQVSIPTASLGIRTWI